MRNILLTGAALAALGVASPAHAAVILTMAQDGTTNTVTATANGAGTSTTLSASAVPITISELITGGTPINADFALNATSTDSASVVGGNVTQNFSGNFSITNGATNYLSGTFADAVFGQGSGLTLNASTPGESVVFTSSVIPAADLSNPEAIDLSFTNVLPGVAIDNATLASMTAAVAGDFAASPTTAVSEPASLLLFGSGVAALLGWGLRRNRSGGASAA
jgi:hypothetical protein